MPDIVERLASELEKIEAWCNEKGAFDRKKNQYVHPYSTPYHHGRHELALEVMEWLKEK